VFVVFIDETALDKRIHTNHTLTPKAAKSSASGTTMPGQKPCTHPSKPLTYSYKRIAAYAMI
jgi:hypothetical protein